MAEQRTTASGARAFRLSIAGTERVCDVRPGETILKAGLRDNIRIAHLCLVGDCGSCRSQLVTGCVQLKRDISNHISSDELQAGFVLACQCVPQSDVELIVPGVSPDHGEDDAVHAVEGRIESARLLNHDIRELVIHTDQPVRYGAGQYAQIAVPGHATLADSPRCYSFACAPQPDGQTRLHFHVRRVPGGAFTEWLFETDRSGARVTLTAPLGTFGRTTSGGRPMVCIAGGSGLAPIKALLESMVDGPQMPDVTLFFGARTQADLYCIDEIEALAARWAGRFIFVPVLSNEPRGSSWNGHTGYCTEFFDAYCDVASSAFFLCGPPAMVDAARDAVASRVAAAHIHFDRFLDQGTLQTEEI